MTKGGLSGLQIQSRNYAVLGSILESDNANVCTFGRKLMVEGFGLKKNVNLVSLLTRLITVSLCWKYLVFIIPSQLHGTELEGQRVGYFRARIRKDNYKLEIDVERMVAQNW